jgi:hypothetical protein
VYAIWVLECKYRIEMTGTKLQKDDSPIAFCEEKRQLVEELLSANHVLMELHNMQIEGIIHNEPDFERFDDLIHLAREKKEQAKYALISHLETHSC